jgi:hypothetical protein
MAFDAGSVIGKWILDAAGWNKGAKGVNQSNESMGKSIFNAQVAFAAFQKVLSSVTNGLKESVNAFIEQEKQEALLTTVLKSTQNAAGLTKDALIDMAKGFQETTTFGDEAVMSAQNLLLTFTKVGSEVFPEATETILNMSAALGQDLKSSAIQVGKALNDPIMGITALRRVGVQLSAHQEDQIKQFMAVNDIVSAQNIILGELETQFGGVAVAMADTAGGAIAQFDNRMGDLSERMGALVVQFVPLLESAGDFAESLVDIAEAIANVSTERIEIFSGAFENLVESGRSVSESIELIALRTGKTVEQASELYLVNEDLRKVYEMEQLLVERITGSVEETTEATEELNEELTTQRNLYVEMVDLAQQVLDNFKPVLTWAEKFDAIVLEIESDLQRVAEEAAFADVLGEGYDLATEKTKVLQDAIESLINDGYRVEDDTIQILLTRYNELLGIKEDVVEMNEDVAEGFLLYRQGMVAAAESMIVVQESFAETADIIATTWFEVVEEMSSAMSSFFGHVSGIVGMLGNIWSLYYSNQLTNLTNDYKKRKQAIIDNVKDEDERNKQLAELDEEYAEEQAKIKEEQWKRQKRADIITSIINTALAVTRALTAGPILGPILAGIIAGLGAAQTSLIASQPMPAFQMGGVGSGLALVGEEGPELVNLGSTSRIFPADETAAIRGGAGVTQNITFTGDVNSDVDIERTMELAGASLENKLVG